MAPRTCPRSSSLGAAALLLGLLPALAGAAPGPDGPQFLVNSYTTQRQRLPAVASDGAGNFVVVWQSNEGDGTDTDGYGIVAQRFDATGTPQGSEFQVNTYTTGDQRYPRVAVTGSGNFIVAWSSVGSPGSDSSLSSIQGQRFDTSGGPLGSQFQVNTYTTNYQDLPDVSADTTGRFVVVWQSTGSVGTDASSYSVQGQRFSSAGVSQGSQFQVNTYTTSEQSRAAVASEGGGSFVVVWQSLGSSGSDADGFSIQGQRYNSAGTALGGQFQVNTYTSGAQSTSDVSFDGSGFVVTWRSFGSAGTDTDDFSVQAQRYDGSGTAAGSQLQVNTYTTGGQLGPAVATDGAGGFVVAWDSYGSAGADTDGYSIQVQAFDNTGAPVGGELQANTYTTSFQRAPAVAAAGSDFVVVWHSFGDAVDTSFYGVQGQRFAEATTTTSSTSSTTSTTLAVCAAAPVGGCVPAGKGVLVVKEKNPGREVLKGVLKRLVPLVAQGQFGDPVNGSTRVSVCLYDQSDALVAALGVDRAGDICGNRPCWQPISTVGYRYVDAAITADGVQKLIAKGGSAGKGRIVVRGKNNVAKGQTGLPTGVAPALAGHSQATMQVVTSDADCFAVTLGNVRRADGVTFRALGP